MRALGGKTKHMSTSVVFAVIIFAVTLLIAAAARKPSRLLPEKKPAFEFSPAYQVPIVLSDSILFATTPESELARKVETLGFSPVEKTADKVLFRRGSLLGDFSIKIIRVDLAFSLPLSRESLATVRYGSFCLFDTGDLWSFCSELRSKVTDVT
jgi:hypothetical protein